MYSYNPRVPDPAQPTHSAADRPRRGLSRVRLLVPAIAALLGLAACGGVDDGTPSGHLVIPDIEWQVVFEDNFDGDSLDLAKWNVDEGDGCPDLCGWGNNEAQVYSADNITVANGILTIQGRQETDGTYTSGRINSKGKFDFRYGRVEVMARLPEGQGTWPAIWMLASDQDVYGPWPASGEIDIAEGFNLGVDGNQKTQSTTHYGLPTPPFSGTSSQYDSGSSPSQGFHEYALEWERDKLRFYVDGQHFQTQNSQNWYTYFPADADRLYDPWGAYEVGRRDSPFDQLFHLILNFAIGGNAVGSPDAGAFPQSMEVDYVRVYTCANANPDTGRGCGTADASVVPLSDNDGGPLADAETAQPYRESLTLYTDGPETLELDVSGTVYTNTLEVDGYTGDGATVINDPAFPDPDDDTNTVWHIAVAGGVANAYLKSQDLTDDPILDTGFNFSGNRLGGLGGDPVGELAFDMQVNSYTPGTKLLVKLDSGFPNLGEVVIPESEIALGQWKTYSVKFDWFLANPGFVDCCGGTGVDLKNVLNPFVLEVQDGDADVYVDNIRVTNACKVVGACGADLRTKGVPDVVVFDDAVNTAVWTNGIVASDSGTGYTDYNDPNSANKINWAIVPADDASRGDVIQVTFKDSSDFGVWFVQSAAGVDLSAYNAGAIVFDIRVLDYGTNTAGMTFKVDCFYPCTSGDKNLGFIADGVWETVTFPVSQLTGTGLDLTTVNTGIVVFPTTQAGGITFQLDNIRWVAETEAAPLQQIDLPVTFEEPDVDYTLTDFGGAVSVLADDPSGAMNTVAATTKTAGSETWAGTVIGTDAGFANPIPFTATETTVSAQVYSPAAGIPVLLKVENADASVSSEVMANTTVAGGWETLSWDFSSVGIDTSATFVRMIIFFDFGQVGNDAVYYWDDVKFGAPTGAVEPKIVFDNAVDPTWDGGITGADDGSGFAGYTDGTNPANKANWAIVDSGEPDHGAIVDVIFNDTTNFGVWWFSSLSPVDMTAYADAEVVFDIRVLDYGDAPGMTMKIDCGYPCTSGDQDIGRVGDGAWETVRVPVSQLVAGGLNLATVNTGLVLFPTAPQTGGINFQVDNVRWE